SSGRAQRGLDLADHRGESGLVVHRHVGQDLAVEADPGLVQAVDEGTVGDSVRPRGRIDPGDPQRTEHALLGTPVAVGVLTRLHDRLDGDPIDIVATAAIALGSGQDLLVTGARGYSTFDSRHVFVSLRVRQHGPNRRDVGRVDIGGTTQLTLVLGRLLGEDVALERLSSLDGATRADLEALRGASLGLHLGHIDPFALSNASTGARSSTGTSGDLLGLYSGGPACRSCRCARQAGANRKVISSCAWAPSPSPSAAPRAAASTRPGRVRPRRCAASRAA